MAAFFIQPQTTGSKRSRVPDQLEKRPRTKKLKEPDDGDTYQFKKILKKAPSAPQHHPQRQDDRVKPATQAREPSKPVAAAEPVRRIGDGPLTEDEKEKLLAMVENDDEVSCCRCQ